MNPWVVTAIIGLLFGGPAGAVVAVVALWLLRFVIGIFAGLTGRM